MLKKIEDIAQLKPVDQTIGNIENTAQSPTLKSPLLRQKKSTVYSSKAEKIYKIEENVEKEEKKAKNPYISSVPKYLLEDQIETHLNFDHNSEYSKFFRQHPFNIKEE